MRRRQRLERLLLAASSALLAADGFLAPLPSPSSLALAAPVAALLVFHAPRRQLAPLYASLAAAALLAALPAWRAALWRSAALSLALAWAASLLFPWPDFSELHGRFDALGCVSARLGGVECRVFYPAVSASASAPAASYLHHGEHALRGLSAFTRLPAWVFGNLRNGRLAAVERAPVLEPEGERGWPLAVFSHGLGGSLELYAHVNQQLASSGRVVVVLNHADGSASVAAPEPGRVEYYRQISREVRDNVGGAGFRFRNAQLGQRVRELRAALSDALDRASRADAKASSNASNAEVSVDDVLRRVDARSVSAVGHSFGAATALSAAHEDARIGRVVLLDAWMEPLSDEARDGLGARAPVLHVLSEHFWRWKDNFASTKRHAQGCTHAESRLVVLRGSRHNNFSDIPLFSPRVNRWMKAAGAIDPYYALRAVGQLSAAFLAGGFVTRATEFPEVETIAL